MAIDWASPLWGTIQIKVVVEGDTIAVSGNTYGIKEDLKPLGARFRGADRSWVLPNTAQVYEGLQQVVAKHGGRRALQGQPGGKAPSPMDQGEALPPMNLRPRGPDSSVSSGQTKEAHERGQGLRQEAKEPKDLTIAQFVARVEGVLRQQFPQNVWLVGEIQNLSVRNTATYFQLAEPKQQSTTATMAVNALIWANKARLIQRTLTPPQYHKVVAEGMQVRVLCQVRLYKDRGSLSLTVVDIDPAYSEGVLALQRQKVLKALRAKGVAERNKQLAFSPLPLTIGLISAPDSRAINDFLHQLHQYGYPGRVIVHHAAMQGEKTSPEVRKALAQLASPELGLDGIVITRGGGSAGDLRYFDDEALGEAICRCPVPVVAAIGHHDDRSVAEEVAYRREKTPTAAAVFILQRVASVRDFLNSSGQKIHRETRRHLLRHDDQLQLQASRMKQHIGQRLATERLRLSRGHSHLKIAGQKFLHDRQQQLSLLTRQFGASLTDVHYKQSATLKTLAGDLYQGASASLARRHGLWVRSGHQLKSVADKGFFAAQRQLTTLEGQLEKSDPEEWRKRGLIRLTTADGKVVRSLGDVAVHELLSSRLVDGVLEVTVTRKRPR